MDMDMEMYMNMNIMSKTIMKNKKNMKIMHIRTDRAWI